MILTRRFWLGLLVSIGLLVLFLWKVDFAQTGRELRDANYAYYLPAVLVYFVAFWFRSLRWRYLLLHLKPISSWRLYPVVTIGYLANNILPMRLGELVRAHFVGEKEDISKTASLATIGVERVFDGLTLLFLAAVVSPFLPWTDVLRTDTGDLKGWWVALSVVIAVAFVSAFVIFLVLATAPQRGRRWAGAIASLAPRALRPRVEALIELLIEGLGAMRSKRTLLMVALLSLPVWLTEAAMYYIIAISFDLDVGFDVILLVTVTSNLATAVPSSIGGIGPFEVVAKATLVAFAVDSSSAAAYVFFVHIVALWIPVNIMGLAFLWKENLSIGQLARTGGIGPSPFGTDQPPGLEGQEVHSSGLGRARQAGTVEYADKGLAAQGEEGE